MPELPTEKLIVDATGITRCWWCGDDLLYVDYHDNEWGRPVVDDHKLFEKICLEGFQAGLSWLTILRKRDNFRAAFCEFEFDKVARLNKRSVEKLLANPGIVRHRGKIESTINNAKRARKLADEFGSLAEYFWQYEDTPGITETECPAKTSTSIALSKDLKQRGWTFIGPTTAYAFMQAMGLVNDHLPGCVSHQHVQDQKRSCRRI